MFRKFRHWLSDAPIADDVDRRNAPVMQLLLLAYGVLLPAAWIWSAVQQPQYLEFMTGFLPQVVLTAGLSWVSFALIRRGKFKLAIVLFLAAQLVALALDLHRFGTRQVASIYDASDTIVPLVIAGLVLGRRALWIVLGMLMVAFAIGLWTDLGNGDSRERVSAIIPGIVVGFLLITIIIDRTIHALRESLAQSNARGERLQQEMADRERAQAQLMHAQKMEASGRLANGVAHDFNNLLGLIRGYARLRHEAMDDEDAQRRTAALDRSLERIEGVADRGSDLVRKLLTFSRSDALNVQTFDAVVTLRALQPLLRQLFPPSMTVALPASEVPLPVHLDRSEFELMVLNIAANARDAMDDDGHFRIDARADGDRVEIAFADDGKGMEADVVARIFEPFYSTKSATGGTGLGLSVVHDLVKVVGGDIRATSTPGQGTTIVIRLPRADQALESAATERR